jgi:hypothetical protein
MAEEWREGHDKFSKAKQRRLARNREILIKKNVGYIAPVPSNSYKEGWERIWGKK